jgi:hypothetical protein
MSTPPPSPAPKKPIVVASGMTRRDFITAVLILLGLAGFIGAAIYSTGTAKNPNMLNGVIREKYRSGEQARDIVVSAEKGSRGISEKITDSGCYLKIFVESTGKTYDVMLSESEWERKKVGEKLDFLRPSSERE